MRLVPYKKGFRCLGVAESFRRDLPWSVLAGVVMRRDLIIDGFSFSRATVGGLDATESVVELYRRMGRSDISVIMVGGCIISWFNMVDVERVFEATGVPTMCVTYEESDGLEKYIEAYFDGEDARRRLKMYRRLGPRERVYIRRTGHTVFVRYSGMSLRDARNVVNAYTLSGSVPEPLRVAGLLARGVLRFLDEVRDLRRALG